MTSSPDLTLRVLDLVWGAGIVLAQSELALILEQEFPLDAVAKLIEETNDATDMQHATTEPQQLPGLSAEDRELGQALVGIKICAGLGVRQYLESLWIVNRSTVHRKVTAWKKRDMLLEVKEANSKGDFKGQRRMISGVIGAKWLLRNESRLRKHGIYFSPLEHQSGSHRDTDRPDPLHAVAPRAEDATTEAVATPQQVVAPIAGFGADGKINLGDLMGNSPRSDLERYELRAELIDSPADYPSDWVMSDVRSHRQRLPSMILFTKNVPCPMSCGCKLKGWSLQVTQKRGEPHWLRIMHWGKRRGREVSKLLYRTDSEARELLNLAQRELDVRVLNPVVMPFVIELEDIEAKQMLEDAVPPGYSITFIDRVTGKRVEVNKSSFGKFGAADIGFDNVQDAIDWSASGVNAKAALEESARANSRSHALESGFEDLRAKVRLV